jgi:pantoate--beta-alanine ligase
MEIIRIPRIMQDTCKKYLLKGRSIGLVPTMGALHEGHLSLVKRARMENDISAVSIFINPAQFGPSEDLDRYPRDVENDVKKLRAQEVDILFLPDNLLMYPKGFATCVEVTTISGKLCGAFRPGHFRGVATVVVKLLNIASPTRAYFGQKDFQQTAVIRRMAKDLDLDVGIVVCPTIREQDGLAMSSRNLYLDSQQRQAAAVIYKCLSAASEALRSGTVSSAEAKKIMLEMLAGEPLITKIEYASVYDTNTLDEADQMQGEVLLAIAVRMGEVRLIDNTVVNL